MFNMHLVFQTQRQRTAEKQRKNIFLLLLLPSQFTWNILKYKHSLITKAFCDLCYFQYFINASIPAGGSCRRQTPSKIMIPNQDQGKKNNNTTFKDFKPHFLSGNPNCKCIKHLITKLYVTLFIGACVCFYIHILYFSSVEFLPALENSMR